MSNTTTGTRWWVGIDVSARELMVARSNGGEMTLSKWPNCAAGHQQLIAHLRALGAPVTVCLEASGTYSLDLALALSKAGDWLRVSVVNPRWVRRFAESLGQRSKTDPVDARVLAQYAQRVPLERWQGAFGRSLAVARPDSDHCCAGTHGHAA